MSVRVGALGCMGTREMSAWETSRRLGAPRVRGNGRSIRETVRYGAVRYKAERRAAAAGIRQMNAGNTTN